MSKKTMRTRECIRCIKVSLNWSFVLVAIDCIINARYFLNFLILWVINFVVLLFPAILYRYKIRKASTQIGNLEAAGVVAIIEFICLLINTATYHIIIDKFPDVSLDRPSGYISLIWVLPIWWILQHKDKVCGGTEESSETQSDDWEYQWATILRLLPFGIKWKQIESTDFGAMLRKQYFDNKDKAINKDKLAYYTVLSSELAILGERTRQKSIDANPPNRILCDHADKICKKIYRKRYINDAEYASLQKEIEHCRSILCFLK